ncbi:alpha/beta hydrolase [Pusillimonas sp. MFBS29]|uniref:alpha/beta hydrolase n=1 Tax=Pusillimonas sp. MFBS29 TaxID=2886690 RepID=UPI001D113D8A|nr:alpha/beta hydrolase [Pusillimonas sp. MFBS29]MCC2596981.1 alpha/beta hydrolase [Pusillimonas sp. MFBS29]
MVEDRLALIRERLSEVSMTWQSGSTLDEIRRSFEAYLAEVGPRGAAMAEPCCQAIPPGIDGAWIGQGERCALYCHGGGFQIGGVASHASLITRLAVAASMRMLAFDYRLAPEHRYPAAIEDAFTAYQWLLDIGEKPAAIVGDSAGGALALQTAQRARDAGLPLPSRIVLISPWLDLSMQSDSYIELAKVDPFSKPAQLRLMAKAYVGREGPALDSPLVSPLWGDLSGLPPIVAHSGEADITVGDSFKLTERVLEAGGQIDLQVFPGMCHHFQIYEALPEAKESIDALGHALRAA